MSVSHHRMNDDDLRLELEDDDEYYGILRAPFRMSKFWHDSAVDLFEIRNGHANYLADLDDAALMSHLTNQSGLDIPEGSAAPELRVVILKLDTYSAPHVQDKRFRLKVTSGLLERLVEVLRIPRFWITSYLERHDHLFTKTINSCFVENNPTGPSYLRCFYRFHVGWDGVEQAPACAYFGVDFLSHSSTYVLVNAPSDVIRRLRTSSNLGNVATLAARPHFVNPLIMDEALTRWTIKARELRLSLIDLEVDSMIDHPKQLAEATSALHRLAQEWNIIEEDLNNFEDTINFLIDVDKRLLESVRQRCTVDGKAALHQSSIATKDSLDCLRWRLQHLRRWVINYRRRTEISINLVFNRSAQSDSNTNLKIAARTSEIARATHRDSASMITIAAVTLFFLPGTFVSALFSMTFFSFTPLENGTEEFRVSKLYWLYLAVTIPLTVMVLGIWLAWRQWRVKQNSHSAERLEE